MTSYSQEVISDLMSGQLPWHQTKRIMSAYKDEDRFWKVLAVQTTDPRFNRRRNLQEISSHTLKEIGHFFDIYKQLEEKETEVLGWKDLGETHELILRNKADYDASIAARNSTP